MSIMRYCKTMANVVGRSRSVQGEDYNDRRSEKEDTDAHRKY